MKNTFLTILGVIVLIAILYFVFKNVNIKPPVVIEKPVPKILKCGIDYMCDANQTCTNGTCVTNPTVVVERVAVPFVYTGFNGGRAGRHHGGGGHHH